MKTEYPAIIHAVITPSCRTVPRPHFDEDPRLAAFDEAVDRARQRYAYHLENCDPTLLERQDFHVVLMVDSKRGEAK